MLLNVTSYITTDIAAMPLLWVAPLALYLLTFVLAFHISNRYLNLAPVLANLARDLGLACRVRDDSDVGLNDDGRDGSVWAIPARQESDLVPWRIIASGHWSNRRPSGRRCGPMTSQMSGACFAGSDRGSTVRWYDQWLHQPLDPPSA